MNQAGTDKNEADGAGLGESTGRAGGVWESQPDGPFELSQKTCSQKAIKHGSDFTRPRTGGQKLSSDCF